MTIYYSHHVATSGFFSWYRLLFKWKGSIWKSVIVELIIWSILYFSLRASYTYWMSPGQREIFEDIAIFCNTYSSFLPITFMLGFYLNAVFQRWQRFHDNIGWIDTAALAVAAHVKGTNEEASSFRKRLVRYLVLVQALVFSKISVPVAKKFKEEKSLVDAGFLTMDELATLKRQKVISDTQFYLPIKWAISLVGEARDRGIIHTDLGMKDILDKIYKWREQIVSLRHMDSVQIPLAYTQVIHLSVSSFFIAAIMGRQFLHPDRPIAGFVQPVDPVVPVMSMLEFIFIVGWTKVAEMMLNPLGEDDDDFGTEGILKRNLEIGLAIVEDNNLGVLLSVSLRNPPQAKENTYTIQKEEPSTVQQTRNRVYPAAKARGSEENILPYHVKHLTIASDPFSDVSDCDAYVIIEKAGEHRKSGIAQTSTSRQNDGAAPAAVGPSLPSSQSPSNHRLWKSKKWKSVHLDIESFIYLPVAVYTFYYLIWNRRPRRFPVLGSFSLRLLCALIVITPLLTTLRISFRAFGAKKTHFFIFQSYQFKEVCNYGTISEHLIEVPWFVGLAVFVFFNDHYPRPTRGNLFWLALTASSAVYGYIITVILELSLIYKEIEHRTGNHSLTEDERALYARLYGDECSDPWDCTVYNYLEFFYVALSEFLVVTISIAIAILYSVGEAGGDGGGAAGAMYYGIQTGAVLIVSVGAMFILFFFQLRKVDPDIWGNRLGFTATDILVVLLGTVLCFITIWTNIPIIVVGAAPAAVGVVGEKAELIVKFAGPKSTKRKAGSISDVLRSNGNNCLLLR